MKKLDLPNKNISANKKINAHIVHDPIAINVTDNCEKCLLGKSLGDGDGDGNVDNNYVHEGGRP